MKVTLIGKWFGIRLGVIPRHKVTWAWPVVFVALIGE